MATRLFYNADLVEQLAACGITARRRSSADAPAAGFVIEGRRAPLRARQAVTNVIAVREHVTITGPRQLTALPPPLALPASTAPGPQTALELVEECARLRRDNQNLSNEVTRLRAEINRLTAGPAAPPPRDPPDDASTRFSLLELS